MDPNEVAALLRVISSKPRPEMDPAPAGMYGGKYDREVDWLAAQRRMFPWLQDLGFGNPVGIAPMMYGIGSDIYGAFDRDYQRRSTQKTRDMYSRQQTVRDAEGQPGGFYGNKK